MRFYDPPGGNAGMRGMRGVDGAWCARIQKCGVIPRILHGQLTQHAHFLLVVPDCINFIIVFLAQGIQSPRREMAAVPAMHRGTEAQRCRIREGCAIPGMRGACASNARISACCP